MRKILIVIMIILFILGLQHPDIKEYTHTDGVSYTEMPTDEPSATPIPLSASISVTAVGDCTLATDINAQGAGSFVNEVENQNNDYSYFFRNVKKYFDNDDLTIVNFEGVLSNNGSRADKQFAFRGDPNFVNIISESSVEAANLANNHTRDYGLEAFDDTIQVISGSGVIPFGWDDISVTEINGIRVGLIGTNALNSVGLENYPSVFETLKSQNPDLIIANFHWGIERDAFPTEQQKELAHAAIDNGADLVIGHHPHVVQGIEKYNGRYILYSLGNFCFGGNKNPSDKDSMIFKQTFTFKEGQLLDDDAVSVIPCSISSTNSRNNYQPTPLSGSEYERVKEKILTRSSKFTGIENINFIS